MGRFRNLLSGHKTVPEKEVVKPVEKDDEDKAPADPTVDPKHVKEQRKTKHLFSNDKEGGDPFIDVKHKDYKRRDGESQHDYNERVPATLQPVEDVAQYDYLGRKRD